MSSTEAHTAKRQRTDDAQINRSDIWKSDGSVVLQAANVQFRVHWSVLAQHSPLFSDMQGLPQPAEHHRVEGCPVVELFDDPADVENLLNALYTPSFHCQDVLPFPVVRALVRLGRKYDFKYLFDSAITRIASELPTTLDEYDTKTAAFYKTIQEYKGLTFDLISLASESGIMTALPIAYYRVLKWGVARLLQGVDKLDGSVAFLSPLDLSRCVIAREKLLMKQFQPGYSLGWARKWVFDDCTGSTVCSNAREAVLAKYMDQALMGALLRPSELKGFKFCSACAKHAHDCIISGRKKMWAELPGVFGLPPWKDL
ncbi:BTB domain-containing protein, partial [Favolaschia claudopus]